MAKYSAACAGVDVGGTFTDVVVYAEGHRPRAVKVPATPGDQAEGVAHGDQVVTAPVASVGSLWGLCGGRPGAPGRNTLLARRRHRGGIAHRGTWPLRGERVRSDTREGGGWGAPD